ncbi:hypothetical protein [Hymenobacter rubidus]|uniref:hypothetical protein n=1 Tax=Hymenobacter rubidus TaxID=1441626 RepID=UPI00191E89F7|nr:hypothetical protein [Hymenobacter rubidus]
MSSRLAITLWFHLLLVLGARTAAAQPTAAVPDTARAYKHHLGLTASPQLDQFFTANRALPIGLLYRRQTRPNRAWRARAVGRYQFDSGDAPLLVGHAYREHTASLELAWGKERWLPLSRRFTAYAGGEVGGRLDLYRKNSEYYRFLPRFNPGYPSYVENAVGEQQESRITQAAFIQAYAGIRLRISQRLYAEAETGLPVTFSHQRWKVDGVEYFLSDRNPTGATNKGDNTYYSLSAQFRPISRIHVFFLF